MKALAFRAVCVELIVGQIQRQGQKLSERQIHLQNLRGHPDGFSWLVIKAPGLLRFSSKHSTPQGVFRDDIIVGACCR